MSSSPNRQQLEHLINSRDGKRQHFQDLLQRKRQLEQETKDVINEMQAVQDDLLKLDDVIEAFEEEHPQQQQGDSSDLAVTSAPLTITMNPGEILPDPPSTLSSMHNNNNNNRTADVDDGIGHQTQAETLTDPLTSTQADIEDDNDDSTAAQPPPQVYATTASLPQLVLQNVDNNKSDPTRLRIQTMDAFVVKPSKNPSLPPAAAAATTTTTNCPFSQQQITQTLQRTFHIPNFREHQLEIVQTTLSGHDCFVLMRTGGGKSLTYQLPVALERPRVTVVISPLLSLIQDQQDQMNDFVPGCCVSFTSGMGTSEHAQAWQRVRDPQGGIGMILVTPEKVYKSNKLRGELQKLHDQGRLARFVIDECHCACQWGHDFRPDYAKLGVLKTHFPTVPVLAVTATASDRVRHDCVGILRLSTHYQFFRSTANRPNLTYQVRPKESPADTMEDMAHFIGERYPRSAGIVYTFSKKDADTVADLLCERGIIAESYHSDVSATKKLAIHKSWMRNETQVVVATIAFGLGINKPDVRFVLHHTLSKTLEAYYQESGRAGRDGAPADCVLYYSPKDVTRMIRLIHGDSSEPLFYTMVRYAQHFGSDRICRAIILQNLGEPDQHLPEVLAAARDDDAHTNTELKDVVSHAQTVLQLLFLKQDDKVTLSMLVKEWRANKSASAAEW
jgi:ATP-dependent DNA helicase Q1